MKVRTIAIHLPQFHPIKENDEWWGKGFTEWTNVSKAQPLFKDHYQPHLPADMGFYDLRLADARAEQAKLAKEYGIYGFCYYHYWFNGRRVLERPLQEILASGEPDFPFMVCWANENWTRVWNGSDKDVLLKQDYSPEDDREHIQYLITLFEDPRYIRVDGKPVVAIYRSTMIPDPKTTTDIWREEAAKKGMELYICRFESFGEEGSDLIKNGGFDAAVEFQPMGKARRTFETLLKKETSLAKFRRRVRMKLVKEFPKLSHLVRNAHDYGTVIDYKEYVEYSLGQPKKDYKIFPGITPMWDNSARKQKNYIVFHNSSPSIYKYWFKKILDRFKPYSKDENLVFINAWNEWAEGNHLEPCRKWGRGYLEATKEVLSND
ncbi:glycoside hydrolase family 99-like domain-containing protein [Mucilaginibacter sp. JRF]|uniref:glycoside hydrolase family 99-like domain-containing protein n=1 Tax=Mucilaginibacter sp. JRF TaxID=2780088 RepID=UPI001880D539|nr:glycoside hydrolase family 99-like domain-containing protein [Mucilaginibacter sp. JRF]MBE9585364.1 glycoside hydrolase family 99-like domain-containing protein [Mucilaginibacter sp. JRF]